MQCVTLPRITEINPHLLCVLCGGYYIDATSIIECLHAFCKSCIVRYLETHKYCPICDVLVHKTEPLQNIRPDLIRQSIVYKLVPNLYKKEMRNRRNFYVHINPQLHPSCSESKGEITEASSFFSMDDLVNLSFEYVNSIDDKNVFFVAPGSKRYFRCRAAVTIKSLRKLLTAKYALGIEHKIHLFFDGNQLPDHFKLLDIAYISSWKRVGYIRVLFEILTVDRRPIISKEEVCIPLTIESSIKECEKMDADNRLAESKLNNVDTGKTENLDSGLRMKSINDSQSVDYNASIKIKDASSSSSNVKNEDSVKQSAEENSVKQSAEENSVKQSSDENSVKQSSDENLICLDEVHGSSSTLSPKHDDKPADKEIISSFSPVLNAVVSPLSNDKVAPKPVENIETSKSKESRLYSKNDKIETQKARSDQNPSAKEQPVTESNTNGSINKAKAAKTNSLAVVAPAAKNNSSILPSQPPTLTKPCPNSKILKKERSKDRTDPLPPVPELRMIGEVTKSSIAKSLSVSAGVPRAAHKISVSKMTKSQMMPRFPIAAPAGVRNPLCRMTKNLVSLHCKTSAPNNSTLKRPQVSHSILKIDPKTLSPIESTSSSSSSSSSNTVVTASNCSPYRKMLPCRPVTSNSYTSNNIFTCASLPIHTTSSSSSPFGKHSPMPLYSPFPMLERSSLHPMNELVRRMFPTSYFAGIDPTKTPVDPSICRLPTYPQSIPNAVGHFLTRPIRPMLVKQTKYEKNRRKQSPTVASRVIPVNGGDKSPVKVKSVEERCGKRANVSLTNGQIKSAMKRKNTELSDFSINNIIPVSEPKRAVVHACSADGVNQVCDQALEITASHGNESRK